MGRAPEKMGGKTGPGGGGGGRGGFFLREGASQIRLRPPGTCRPAVSARTGQQTASRSRSPVGVPRGPMKQPTWRNSKTGWPEKSWKLEPRSYKETAPSGVACDSAQMPGRRCSSYSK